jgi:oxygen-independent coproporphyrinogen-3 oxidase
LCYHEALNEADDIDVYIRYMIKEVDLKLKQIGIADKLNIRHMHWGGGTPTLLSSQQIEKVHKEITERVEFVRDEDNEFSLEAYPDENMITRQKLVLLKELGFNTISFGVQDFDERVQKVINREHKPDTVHSLIALARETGFRVHVDLCYGLPFQGLNELEKTLLEIVKSQPLRMSVNPYTHNPFVFPRQKIIPNSSVPNSFMKIMLALMADSILTEWGYVRIGLDQYVKPEDPFFDSLQKHSVRSLMGYSQNDKVSFLGCGATAISFFDNSFYMNVARLEDYFQQIDQSRVPLEGKRCYRYNEDDRIRNQLIQKYILTHFNIDKKQFARELNVDFDHYFNGEMIKLARHEKDGLVDLGDPDVIRITKRGRFFTRHIAHVFDTFYTH